jgi:hypothetical protein
MIILELIENINYTVGKNLIIDISKHYELENQEIDFLIDKFLNRPAILHNKKKLLLE